MRTDWDLLVIGAGPAGCISAFHAARSGLRVCLVDKQSFPRVKPCAGGITTKALLRLPFSIASEVEATTNVIRAGLHGRPSRRFVAPGIICAFVDRPRFDALLLQMAQEAGADFRVVGKILDLQELDDRVVLKTEEDTLTARFLIAADGANSTIRRLIRPEFPNQRGFAIEGKIRMDTTRPKPEMELIFGGYENGYAWIFPKHDHVNIGLYTIRAGLASAKARLKIFAADTLQANVTDIVRFPLGFGGEGYMPTCERVLFVGNAAGMAEPLFGEGIHNALKTGEAAGRLVVEAVRTGCPISRRYSESLAEGRRDIQLSRRLAERVFYPNFRSPMLCRVILPFAGRALVRAIAAGQTLDETRRDWVRIWLRKPGGPLSALSG